MKELIKFKNLGLSSDTLLALSKKGFEEPTAIQEKCIPLLLKDKTNIVGQAQTGTGKTAAFGLPVIELVKPDLHRVQAIILAPTRELAIQVAEELNSLKGNKRLKIAAIYGGQAIGLQIRRLEEGAQIVVGTPGRVLDHLNRRKLILDNLAFFILDEADEMLNMGFIDDVETILKATPKNKRMLLFSATMPSKILRLAQRYMPDYEYVKIEKETLTTNLTDQIYFEVRESDKFEALSRIIDVEPEFYGLIFCRTKIDADRVANRLIDRGYDALGIHGDIPQNQREKILIKFKNKQINILVATDVAARGIDVSDLTHVINFSLPQDPESYVHRIGRTGRAGKEGTAITFITPYEYSKLVFIKNSTNTSIRKEKIPEIDAIIEIKKNRIVNDVKEIIEKPMDKDFQKLAKELTEVHDSSSLVAALLQHAFKDKLDKSKYSEIKEFSQAQVSVDTKGKNRLFVAMGGRNGMTKHKLVEYITNNAGVDGASLEDIRVYDDFSFVSVPFCEAEIILRAFKKLNHGKRPIVVKAKPKK